MFIQVIFNRIQLLPFRSLEAIFGKLVTDSPEEMASIGMSVTLASTYERFFISTGVSDMVGLSSIVSCVETDGILSATKRGMILYYGNI